MADRRAGAVVERRRRWWTGPCGVGAVPSRSAGSMASPRALRPSSGSSATTARGLAERHARLGGSHGESVRDGRHADLQTGRPPGRQATEVVASVPRRQPGSPAVTGRPDPPGPRRGLGPADPHGDLDVVAVLRHVAAHLAAVARAPPSRPGRSPSATPASAAASAAVRARARSMTTRTERGRASTTAPATITTSSATSGVRLAHVSAPVGADAPRRSSDRRTDRPSRIAVVEAGKVVGRAATTRADRSRGGEAGTAGRSTPRPRPGAPGPPRRPSDRRRGSSPARRWRRGPATRSRGPACGSRRRPRR